MQIVVLSNESLIAELASDRDGIDDLIFLNDISKFEDQPDADVVIDLLFDNSPERITILEQQLPKLVIINSVTDTLSETNSNFIRINGWPTFLKSTIIEASGNQEHAKQNAERTFQQLNKTLEWLPDQPGFVTPRVISMIVNEAYYALSEGVSTKEEIDIAMKLGTNYPYGPFEWAERIGVKNITALLNKLSEENLRYKPCKLLIQEIG
jgi:3-hydroxybutyryl-CoA dehydrogenase